jgi:dienelactone hydrolase
MRSWNRRWWLAALVGVSLVAAACSGGGGDGGPDDPTEGVLPTGERLVSFSGAGGMKLAGTLALPQGARGGAPAVLIVPTIGPTTDREGIQSATQGDLLYKDLSNAFTAAGMVTLRYDRRGIGGSKLDSGQKPTYDQMIEDARGALRFLGQRGEVGSSPVAVVGHEIGGWMAMRLASTETRVKSVALVSTPGRPMVDVLADGFRATHGQASADRFRATVTDLVATGVLPGPEGIAPEHQGVLGQGQDEILKAIFSVDPLADASKVKVPTLVITGNKSTTVGQVDADRLAAAIGPPASVTITESTATLREFQPDTGPIAFDPNNEATHVFGARPVTDVPRDKAGVDRIVGFVGTALKGGRQ